MHGYYNMLAAERLKKCYDIASPRIKRYLKAEIEFLRGKIISSSQILELGCGYGRIVEQVATGSIKIAGIDTSLNSLKYGKDILNYKPGISFYCMNAVCLGFKDNSFDLVLCLQNGISAFHSDKLQLVKEAIRVTRKRGKILFSTYSEKIWEDRLEWFKHQAAEGLIGEIDESKTVSGNIICKDGFKATTIKPAEFISLVSSINIIPIITEVDESSIFFEIEK
jgi:2-polyprenyl-6-hydroxyphenyl methylase/3-demethylubiquinone-9 3-methyltransferase